MTTEFPERGVLAEAPSKRRPWAGVVFSLFVPGFGIARGGRLGQAVAWFLGLEVGMVVVGLCLALEKIPFGVGVAAAVCLVLAFLAMLYQSYLPGNMTGKHWAAFIGVWALTVVAGTPVGLVVRPFKMPTRSMSPTIKGADGQGDHVFVDRLTYRFSSPHRGDLLVFVTEGISGLPQDQIYVKRIIGMPGERVEIREGSVFANGTRLTEREGIPPIHFATREAVEHGDGTPKAYQVDKESYFVLGDNATNSLDSRYFGCVPRQNAHGKVTAIYYPFSRAGRPQYLRELDSPANRSQPIRSETNKASSAAGSDR